MNEVQEKLGRESTMLAIMLVVGGKTAEEAWRITSVVGRRFKGRMLDELMSLQDLRDIERDIR